MPRSTGGPRRPGGGGAGEDRAEIARDKAAPRTGGPLTARRDEAPRASAVVLWRIDTRADRARLEAAEACCRRLADDEEERARLLTDPERAADWRAAHIALRLALEVALGPGVRRIAYRVAPGGRPSLPVPGAPAFSLSHSGRHALIATTDPGPVGVDIEVVRPLKLDPARVRRLIAAGCGLVGTTVPASIGYEAVADPVRAWARLEAFGKARGTGVGAVLAACDIAGRGAAEGTDAHERAARLAAASGLVVRDVDMVDRADVAAAVACRAPTVSSSCSRDIQDASALLEAVQKRAG